MNLLAPNPRSAITDVAGIKVGHPYPPRGRLARLFLRYRLAQLQVDYRVSTNDRILFQKAGDRS